MSAIDKKLLEYFKVADYLYCEKLFESITYSLMAGGKRIRPQLVLEFFKATSKADENFEKALPFACAIEMIHCYSLIHDDLPCMDNDDLRRGKPTNHKVFGEDTALLAGDALLTKAFDVSLCEDTIEAVGASTAVKCASLIAKFAGEMVKGQCIDLQTEGKQRELEIVEAMDIGKTVALIKASCMMGVLCGGGDEALLKSAENYALYMGLAFQIRDDMLDMIGDSTVMGKNTGNDTQNEKCNYLTLLGLKECEVLVEKYSKLALKELEKFPNDTSDLKELTISLIDRIK